MKKILLNKKAQQRVLLCFTAIVIAAVISGCEPQSDNAAEIDATGDMPGSVQSTENLTYAQRETRKEALAILEEAVRHMSGPFGYRAMPKLMELEQLLGEDLGGFLNDQRNASEIHGLLYDTSIECLRRSVLRVNSSGRKDELIHYRGVEEEYTAEFSHDADDFATAIKILTLLGDYNDALQHIADSTEEIYQEARIGSINSNVPIYSAIWLAALGDYKDTRELLDMCEQKLEAYDLYRNAEDSFCNGEFEAALTLFMQFDGGYLNADLYIKTISAYIEYTERDYVNALSMFHDAKEIYVEVGNVNDIFEPIIEKLEFSSDNDDIYERYYSIYENCLSNYFEQQKEAGNDLEKRIGEMRLADFLSRTDNSVSPVSVAGNGIYIIPPERVSYGNNNILFRIAPNCMASKPEDIRYVMSFSQSYEYCFTYDDGTIGYTCITIVTIKDVSSGEILFNMKFSDDPPRSVYFYYSQNRTDTYGTFSFNNIRSDYLVPVLTECGITVYGA